MSPYRFSFIVGASLLLASCADEMPGSKTSGDGSISFSVDRAAEAVFSRAGGDTPALSFHKTLPVEAVENQKLWLHVESAENPALFRGSVTRAMPVTTDDMDEFTVTALLPDGNVFMQTQTVTKNQSSNLWKTEDTYFWPENDVLTFQCKPTSLPSTLTNLTADGTKFSFNYETPDSDDEKDAEAQKDFVLATHTYSKSDATGGTADILFQHPLAGICFMQDESLLLDDKLRIVKIELSGLFGKGSCEFDGHNPNFTSKMTSKWRLDKSSVSSSYTQTVNTKTVVQVPVNPSKTVEAIAQPFMVIPHTKADLAAFSVSVTLQNGDVLTASLKDVFDEDGLLPGRMYVLTLSSLDAKYPPVEKLQGMAGNGTVSLNWDHPEASPEHIKQCGVTVKVIQKGKDKYGNSIQSDELVTTRHWVDSEKNKDNSLFPSDKKDLDLFAYITEGVNSKGETVLIDTRTYNEFECHVIADYYNKEEQSYKDGNPVIHHSIAKTITIKPQTNDDTVLFYIPEGAGTPEGLLDDDDMAAWDWFKRTYPYGKYVTKDGDSEGNSIEKLMEDGFNVIWVPCGVQLRDGNYGTNVNADDADSKITKAEEILTNPDILPKINLDNEENKDRYWTYKTKYATPLQELGHVPGVYDDWSTGTIKRLKDVTKYFTDADIRAIRDFYGNGGNLLLTTFSIELIYEFEVITAVNRYYGPIESYPYRPTVHFFNEIKPSAIWFIRPYFEDHDYYSHNIYSGMFKCTGKTFPEYSLDIFDGKFPVFVASDIERKVEMFPLLSMGASACENNNVVWDFSKVSKSMKNLEDDNNARFIGTWGQINDTSVGVAIEFYPGKTEESWPWDKSEPWCPNDASEAEKDRIRNAIMNHGRCIAIGLGAYEFNNGLKYDPEGEVLNSYQSNIQLMTRNALNYLMTADPTKTDPTK